MLQIFTVVHPIGPDDVTSVPDGWRWAIHTDNRFDQVAEGCLNAGWEPSRSEAESMLSWVLITARRALTAGGVKSTVAATTLTDCPLTPEIVAELARIG